MNAATVLAHQGGWDEILFVLAPLLVFAGLLWVARKRVDEMESADDGTPPARDASPPPDVEARDGT